MREIFDTREEKNPEDVIYDADQQDETSKNVQKQVEEQEIKKYGMFYGVFVPNLVTILGVIMFLRVGWTVGNSGLLGAFLIITLSFLITSCTALSMSSFVTNTRVGAGGAFSIISQSLGLEVGGSIGIPLYISQALAVTLYIFGFREGWLWVFPNHYPLAIDLGTLATIIVITFISTSFAFRIQSIILAVIIAAIASIWIGGLFHQGGMKIQWWGLFPGSVDNDFAGITFWGVFAVFFPASTGIMAGANMSGELKEPRKSIPLGTMLAIAVSFVVYLSLAYWAARNATPEELVKNYNIFIDRAFWSPIVLTGLLGATFSSALASFVGAPRILHALGTHSILPKGEWVSKRTKRGEPVNALIVTVVIVFAGLMLRNLNMVAPLITMTFLITYSMINLVVLLEKKLKLISFRPSFKIPEFVALTGFLGSLLAIFIIHPVLGLGAIVCIILIFFVLIKKQLKAPFSDVRSGLFNAFAEWSAKRIKLMRGKTERAWKPSILLPVDDINRLHGIFRLVFDIAKPIGSVKILGIISEKNIEESEQQIEEVANAYLKRGIFSSYSVVEESNFSDGIIKGLQALRGTFFRPNILCVELPKDKRLHKNLWRVIDTASQSEASILLLVDHPAAGLGRQSRINLWIPEQSEWKVKMDFENLDLSLLIGYSLRESWDGEINLFVQSSSKKGAKEAESFTKRLIHLARLPVAQSEVIVAQNLVEAARQAPKGDVNIFPLDTRQVQTLWDIRDACNSTCLFCQDSGQESAIA